MEAATKTKDDASSLRIKVTEVEKDQCNVNLPTMTFVSLARTSGERVQRETRGGETRQSNDGRQAREGIRQCCNARVSDESVRTEDG